MTDSGVDYPWSHPSPAALHAEGIRFACRYLSHDPKKNLGLAEAKALSAAGISCVVVWESTANRALSGRSGGIVDATTAAAQAKAAGMPARRPIYMAVDFDATESQQSLINAYLDGAATVLGKDWVGVYGGYYVVKRALDGGHARWGWQAPAWSGGQWDGDPRVVIRQGAQKRIGGVDVDLDKAVAADYGQWTPGGPSAPHTGGGADAFPGTAAFGPGKTGPSITRLGKMLVGRGGHRFYTTGPGPVWGTADHNATAAFQRAQGWTGTDANGLPGPTTWDYLVHSRGHDIPAAPAKTTAPPAFPGAGHFRLGHSDPAVTQLGKQLLVKGFAHHHDGNGYQPGPKFTAYDEANVRDFQRAHKELAGDADGIPGPRTWHLLFS